MTTIKNNNSIWDLDKQYGTKEAEKYCREKGYNKNTHEKFKVGDVITFMVGANKNIPAKAKIKGIDGDDIYVFNDAYWFPIKNNEKYRIKKVTS